MKTFVFHYTNDTILHGVFSATADSVGSAELTFKNVMGEDVRIIKVDEA